MKASCKGYLHKIAQRVVKGLFEQRFTAARSPNTDCWERKMPRVIFRSFTGEQHEVDVPDGTSVMEAAVRNNIHGIDGDCGGAAACATCHVYIDTDWFPVTGPQTETEQSMLAFAEHAGPTSRLGCQIKMRSDLDGLTVDLPENQH